MNEINPKEFKAGYFKWLDRITYRDLGKVQLNLSKKEHENLIIQLASSLEIYEKLVLNFSSIRGILYELYNEIINSRASTSQLSNQFNMSLKGHNLQISKQIDKDFKLAYKYELDGKKFEAANQLKQAKLNYDILFGQKILEVVQNTNTAAAKELIKIQEIRKKLFLSTIKMAVNIARKYSTQLDGNTIEWTDLSQEAILSSMRAVNRYRPIDNGRTFTSFIYKYVSGHLSKKINETTRTVFVPRPTLDRYVYVRKAIDNLGLMLADLRGGTHISKLFNVLNNGRINDYTLQKIAEKATKLRKGNEPFSAEEVRTLLLVTQDEVSLDLEIESADGTESVTLGETLPDETLTAAEQLDGALIKDRLLKILSKYVSPEEFLILKLRYGTGKFHGRKWVSDIYNWATGKPMNKGRISKIEEQMFNRIRREIHKNPDLKKQFNEIISTLPFLTK